MSDLYGIVDTAQDRRLHGLVAACEARHCLFAGELEPPLAQAAPYLVRIDEGSGLVEAWRGEGWGKNWGILCRSSGTLEELRQHFRKSLQVMLPDGAIVLFRFYDPRVWRTYLPTCNAEELAGWFSVIDEYLVETPDGAGMLRYSVQDGALDVATAG